MLLGTCIRSAHVGIGKIMLNFHDKVYGNAVNGFYYWNFDTDHIFTSMGIAERYRVFFLSQTYPQKIQELHGRYPFFVDDIHLSTWDEPQKKWSGGDYN